MGYDARVDARRRRLSELKMDRRSSPCLLHDLVQFDRLHDGAFLKVSEQVQL